jgi:hypothetical protein
VKEEAVQTEDAKLSAEKLEQIQKDFEAHMSNRVYEACILFETLENRGLISGNGHHLAQKMAQEAVDLLKSRWVKRPS